MDESQAQWMEPLRLHRVPMRTRCAVAAGWRAIFPQRLGEATTTSPRARISRSWRVRLAATTTSYCCPWGNDFVSSHQIGGNGCRLRRFPARVRRAERRKGHPGQAAVSACMGQLHGFLPRPPKAIRLLPASLRNLILRHEVHGSKRGRNTGPASGHSQSRSTSLASRSGTAMGLSSWIAFAASAECWNG
jgi:hypothetical protein